MFLDLNLDFLNNNIISDHLRKYLPCDPFLIDDVLTTIDKRNEYRYHQGITDVKCIDGSIIHSMTMVLVIIV